VGHLRPSLPVITEGKLVYVQVNCVRVNYIQVNYIQVNYV